MTDKPSTAHDDSLGAILAEYLTQLDRGESVSRDEVLTAHPERAADLRAYFADADLIARLAGNSSHQPACELASPVCTPGDFGDYELLEEIGRGGMGIVYKVHERTTGRLLALKMLLAGLFASQRDIERFRNEARAAANLKHPAIVPIYHVGEHQGHLFYTMPWIAGTNLARRLAESPFEPRAAAEVMATVAEAVDYAHTCGVIHRDLKPANILLDEMGQPYVADFGVAHWPGDPKAVWGEPGDIVGTLRYMSPEQAEGQVEGLDPRTDVYSLGVTLYEMLARVPAFPEKDQARLLDDIRHGQPIALTELNPAFPADLDAIVTKATAKDAGERYSSAADLVADLRRFLQPQSDGACEQLRVAHGGKRFGPNRTAALASFGVAAVLVCAGGLWLWRARGSNETVTSRDESPPLPEKTTLLLQERGQELLHPDRREDYFGTSLAAAHDRIFVGALGSQSVYVYDADSRRLIQTISRQGVVGFGVSLAVNDELLVVGAHSHDSHAGVVTLCNLATGKPLRAIRNPSLSPAGDHFGARVAMGGNRVLVTAPMDSDDGQHTGVVYMFDADTGDLVRRFASPADNSTEGLFGMCLTVTHNHLFVGLPRSDPSMHSGSVYQIDLETGQLVRTFSSPVDQRLHDYFGYSLAILADEYLIVGAPHTNAETTPRCGAAYLFRISTGELLRTYFSPNPSSHGNFGSEVAAAGDSLAIISAIGEGPSIPLAGRVYAVEAHSGRVLATYESPERSDGDWFGGSVATWGDKLVIGASGYGGEDRGAAFVFDLRETAGTNGPDQPDAPARE